MATENIVVQYEPEPSQGTIQAAAELYVELMKNDPTFRVAASGRPEELGMQMSLGVIKPLALVSGEMYTAKDNDGKLVGFTLWTAPGREVFDTPDQLEMGYQDYLDQLDDEARKFQAEVMGKTIPRFIDRTLEMEKAVVNSYWCCFAMVQKEHQGKGLCHKMFNMIYKKGKATGATMGLITGSTHNVMIYEKMGLKLRGEEKMPSPWADWSFYSMSRDTKE